MEKKEILDKAIYAHSQWKQKLKKAIATQKTELPVKDIANPHLCEFGKWLDKQSDKTLLSYQEIFRDHAEFHKQAAEIANLAVLGKAAEAEEKMQFGSEFTQVSAKLINLLTDVKKNL